MRAREQLYIDGRWVAPSGRGSIDVIDASTEEIVGRIPSGNEEDVDRAVQAAARAFEGWAATPVAERARWLERLKEGLAARAEEIATTISAEVGTPITVAKTVQAGLPVSVTGSYPALVREFPFEERIGNSLIVREPVGVVAAITPWNYPLHQAMGKVAPALAAGCTVVLKPATETVLDALLMSEAAVEAGLPAGVLNVVPAGRGVGAYLVSHPQVDKVSFTGSTAAGRTIAETCGRLLRPVTLELGGKSAAIVLDDADLQSTIESFFASTLLNNGQICWLGTRVLAPRSRYDEVVDTVTGLAASLRLGDPMDPATQVGPLVSSRQRDRVESYIAKGLNDGARLTAGGGRPKDQDHGWFVEPTVFAEVDNQHAIAQEEIFGPVLSVIPYASDDEAVAIANDSDYGLGGTVWTTDPERGEAVARKVSSGTIGINAYVNDPTAPFGGINASGIGRELGPEGLHGYQVLKTVYR